MAGDGECNNITIDNEVAAAIKYLQGSRTQKYSPIMTCHCTLLHFTRYYPLNNNLGLMPAVNIIKI